MAEYWYDNRENLAVLARYLYDEGYDAEEIVEAMEKPFRFEDQYRACTVPQEEVAPWDT